MKEYEEKYKQIFRYLSLGMSQNEISKILSTSRNTVRKVKTAADSIRLSWEDVSKMTSEEFARTIFHKDDTINNDALQPKPYCEILYKELQKTGVTRKLLWEEYFSEVKAVGKIPLQYSQFCNYFNRYIEVNKAINTVQSGMRIFFWPHLIL